MKQRLGVSGMFLLHTVLATAGATAPPAASDAGGLATASWVLAGVTIVLVVVTAYYAWQTRKTVAEMRIARMDSALPVVCFRHSSLADNADSNRAARHKVINQGPGTALQISADVAVDTRNVRNEVEHNVKQYVIPALGPGAEHEVFLELANYHITGFAAVYKDVYDRKLRTVQALESMASSQIEYFVDGQQLC